MYFAGGILNNNGSLKIEGDFEIVDRNGGVYNLQGREVVGICRCGHFVMVLTMEILNMKRLHLICLLTKRFNADIFFVGCDTQIYILNMACCFVILKNWFRQSILSFC